LHLRKILKTNSTCLTITILIICLSLPLSISVHPSSGAQVEYTYYGVVPSKIYRWVLNDLSDSNSGWRLDNGTIITASPLSPSGMTVATKSLLAVVAAQNSTNVGVYSLTLGSWTQVWGGSLDSMGKKLVLLDNGTTFKVVSDKIVSVLLLNYQQLPSGSGGDSPVPHTFYTDVNGLYVGKEFVLMASTQAYYYSGQVYAILALEKATITVTRDDGHQDTYTLGANSYQYILLSSFRVYKIESTGNIMIESGLIPSIANSNEGTGDVNCFPVPSAQGGFVGTFFLTISIRSTDGWDSARDYGFRISASANSHVQVYDLATQKEIKDLTVTGVTGIAIQPWPTNAIAVQSDNPITLSLIHNGSIVQSPPLAGNKGGRYSSYGNGVMFIGIQPNKETMVYLPTDAHVEAYFFASNQTQLTIDGAAYTIPSGSSYFYNQPGTHTVESNSNVVLQINCWPNAPDNQGLWYTGAAIPCIETVNNTPTVTLTPLGGGGFPMTYVIIGVGAGVAVVAVVVGILMMRRRGGKPA
jgi:hypothetical protein